MSLPGQKNTSIFILLLPLIASCATILNQPIQKLTISTDSKLRVVSVSKAIFSDSSSHDLPYSVNFVSRSNQPLTITVQVDSAVKQIQLKSKKSFAYWYNIPGNYGIGMLVDKDNIKRYAYPSRFFLTAADTGIKISRFGPTEKGTTSLSISLPFINAFTITTINQNYSSAGVFGIKAGLEYYHHRNRYLSVNAGAATDVFGEYFLLDSGYVDHGSAWFANLNYNYVAGSFELGYGLHLSTFNWTRQFGDTTKTTVFVENKGLGPGFSAQYRVGNYFRIGVLYLPMLINLQPLSFSNYQHYFSIDLIWKFSLRRSLH